MKCERGHSDMRVELTVMVYSLGVRPGITFPWKSNRDISA